MYCKRCYKQLHENCSFYWCDACRRLTGADAGNEYNRIACIVRNLKNQRCGDNATNALAFFCGWLEKREQESTKEPE